MTTINVNIIIIIIKQLMYSHVMAFEVIALLKAYI